MVYDILISWVVSKQMVEIAEDMGYHGKLVEGEVSTHICYLCQTCIDEQIADGDTVVILGESDHEYCSSCETRYVWPDPE